MRDEIRCLSDGEIDLVAGGTGIADGTSNTMMILPRVEQDNAFVDVQASTAGETKSHE